MLNKMISLAIFVTCAVGLGANIRAQEVLAVYGEAASSKGAYPPNWQFLWNAKGAIGNSKSYAQIPYDQGSRMFCLTNNAGKVDGTKPRINMTGQAAEQDPEKIGRYWIAAYTITNDSPDVVWLRHGNVSHRYGGNGNGITLEIFVNDSKQQSFKVPRQRRPTLFQQKLGKLKRGDVVYIMVGPGEKRGGYFNLHFMLERWPEKAELPEPINILSPDITEVTPHRDARGNLRQGYLNHHKHFVKTARQKEPKLVFLGDSITAGWPRDMLNKHFGQYQPANHGISGDWIQGLRWRVAHGIYDQIQPRLIVLLIGVNNLSNGFTPEEVALGTKLLVQDIRTKTPSTKILLLGIFPRGRTFVAPAGDNIREVNAMTAQLADQKHVFFMDLAEDLIESDGSISKEVFPDGLHPGRAGYLRWAQAIAPKVEELFASH